MALSLAEALREARSIPFFDGKSEYSLTHFLRDGATILSLTNDEEKFIISKVLCNKLKGRALHVIQQLYEPSFEGIINKLKEEFGIKSTFLNLRNEAMNIRAIDVKDLHSKLGAILLSMNTKYYLEGENDILYTPNNNSKLIFDIYLQFLPFNVKTLLLQNQITNMEKAFTYYLENYMLTDFRINNRVTNTAVHAKNYKYPYGFSHNFSNNSNVFDQNKNANSGNRNNIHFNRGSNSSGNYNRHPGANQNYENINNYHNNPSGNFSNGYGKYVQSNSHFNSNGYDRGNASGNTRKFNDQRNYRNANNSGRFNNNARYNQQPPVVPMEVDNIEELTLSRFNN